MVLSYRSKEELLSYELGEIIENAMSDNENDYEPDLQSVLNLNGFKTACTQIRLLPGYCKTPLWRLNGLAKRVGVNSLFYKDESKRFGLGSFKPSGCAYALLHVLSGEIAKKHNEVNIPATEILNGKHAPIISRIVVTAATTGNYGIGLAWASNIFGCQSVIYFPNQTKMAFEKTITGFGAKVVRAGETYDASVRQCSADAKRFGWVLVSDAASPGYTNIPRHVMEGYSIIANEITQCIEETPTHVFIQAGIGGLAASICGFFWCELRENRPILVVVEPDKSACLLRSILAKRCISIEAEMSETVMAGLACAEPSFLAFKILSKGAHFFITISDQEAIKTMRLLANPFDTDPPVVGGTSGVAGLAGFLGVIQNARARSMVSLNKNSRILVIGTEGANDRDLYYQYVGSSVEDIISRQHRAVEP
jgi:diaminopropionate ammonia-lyase